MKRHITFILLSFLVSAALSSLFLIFLPESKSVVVPAFIACCLGVVFNYFRQLPKSV